MMQLKFAVAFLLPDSAVDYCDMTVAVMHEHAAPAVLVLCNMLTGPGQASSTSSAAATAIAQAIAQVLVSVFASISSSGSGVVPSDGRFRWPHSDASTIRVHVADWRSSTLLSLSICWPMFWCRLGPPAAGDTA